MKRNSALRTSFCIPQLHLTVVSAAQELGSIVGERYVLDGLMVSHESPQTVALLIDIPQLTRAFA